MFFAVWLDNNHLVGTIPGDIGANLENLRKLGLSSNKFSGSLPDIFDTMHSLTGVDFSNNALRGSLPVSLGNIASLEHLDLSNNAFTGSISSTFCSLNGTEINVTLILV